MSKRGKNEGNLCVCTMYIIQPCNQLSDQPKERKYFFFAFW